MDIVNAIDTQARLSAAELVKQGWDTTGPVYSLEGYPGDLEALGKALGREPTRHEGIALEMRIRSILGRGAR